MKTTLVALNAHFMHTNLALRQILPTLNGFDVRFFEGHINLIYRKLMEQIAQGAPDVIGFSCYIWNISLIRRLCGALRVALPEVKLLLGGPEVAYRAEDVLIEWPEVDFVLSGEGEVSLRALLGAIETGTGFEQVPGLSYRNRDGKILINLKPALMEPEDWVDAYAHGIQGLERRILYIETSRGCPYNCQYCLSSAEQGVRALSVEASVERLTRLADGGAQLIKLVDRTFNFDVERANLIWAALIEHAKRTGYKGTYHFEIGAHLIDERALGVLKGAPGGLFQFEVGIQSSDPDVLTRIGRTARFEAIGRAVRAIGALSNIHLHVDLIAGMPGDDMDTFAKSFDDAFSLGAEQLQLGFLKLLHGSELRRDAVRLGIRFEPDAPYEVIRTHEMTFESLCRLKDVEEVLNWYANSGRYKNALKWLLKDRSPFEFFLSVAEAFRRRGVFEVERGEKARAEALLDIHQSEELRALLRHDFLCADRRRDLPDALAFQESPEERALLRARFHPVRGQSAVRHEWDVVAFERREAMRRREVMVIYDSAKGYEVLESKRL